MIFSRISWNFEQNLRNLLKYLQNKPFSAAKGLTNKKLSKPDLILYLLYLFFDLIALPKSQRLHLLFHEFIHLLIHVERNPGSNRQKKMYNLQAMQIVNRVYPCEGNKLTEKLQIIPSIDQRQQQLNQQFISLTEIQFVYNEKKRSKTSENLSVKHKIPLWKCKKERGKNIKKMGKTKFQPRNDWSLSTQFAVFVRFLLSQQ